MDIPQTYSNKRIGTVKLNSIYWFLDQAVQGVFRYINRIVEFIFCDLCLPC